MRIALVAMFLAAAASAADLPCVDYSETIQVVATVDLPTWTLDADDDGDLVVLASNYDGVTLVDLSSAHDPTVPLVFGLELMVKQVAIHGHRIAIMASYPQPRLQWLELSDTFELSTGTAFVFGHDVQDLALTDQYTYTSFREPSGPDRMLIHDHSVLDGVWPVTEIQLDDDLQRMEISGNLLCGLDTTADKLVVFDLTDPLAPSLVSRLTLPQNVVELEVRDDLVYVVGDSLAIVDISEPTAPFIHVVHPLQDVGSPIRSLAVHEPGVFVAGVHRMEILDVSDLSHPVSRGTTYHTGQEVHAVAADTPILFDNQAKVLDTTDGPLNSLTYRPDLGEARDGYVAGDRLFQLMHTQLMRAIDLSNPLEPVVSDSLDLSIADHGRLAGDNEIMVAARIDGGLTVVDVSTPGSWIVVAGTSEGADAYPTALAYRDRTLYVVSDSHGLQIYDLSIPESPVLTGEIYAPDGWMWSASLDGDRLYVADCGESFAIIDISDIHQPTIIGAMHNEDLLNYSTIAPYGGLVYAIPEGGGLVDIVDVSVPHWPVKVGSFSIDDYFPRALIDGEHLYVVGEQGLLQVHDLSDPLDPQPLGTALCRGWSRSEPQIAGGAVIIPAAYYEAAPMACGGTVAVDGPPPTTTSLSVSPNPFNPSTTIHYRLPTADHHRLAVYDLRGRLVRDLRRGHLPAGPHTATWNGRDESGRAVASGVYVARLGHAGGVSSTKLLLAR